jgi:predicted 2-oxoglutarate/Fe(II)-dependent dioxygenase YbiX
VSSPRAAEAADGGTDALAPVAVETEIQRPFKRLTAGDPFPWLHQNVASKANFALDALAGRYVLYCFFLSAKDETSKGVLEAAARHRGLFDDRRCSFVGVTINPADGDLRDQLPGMRFALDFDHKISMACGAVPLDSAPQSSIHARRFWILVDPSLHVLKMFPFGLDSVAEVMETVARLPEPDRFGGVARPAPILLLPNVFEPDLCSRLVQEYETAGGRESGVHRDGVGVLLPTLKRRKDHTIEDAGLLAVMKDRIARRVLPEIEKLFFMRADRIERHIIGCYAAEDGGHFGPHRDNRQGLTAHRRYAVSINLNAGFDGGEVVFPEYNTQGYKAPPGWAVIFPCAILHQVRPVTSGARYAYLPFLYDESGDKIRRLEYSKLEGGPGGPHSGVG